LSDFSEILRGEAVLLRASAMAQIRAFHRTYFLLMKINRVKYGDQHLTLSVQPGHSSSAELAVYAVSL